jgi:hypothetical protein
LVFGRVPPTFVAPAFSSLRWAFGFAALMVADQPLGWLCLGMFCWRFWQTLMRLNTYIERRVRVG